MKNVDELVPCNTTRRLPLALTTSGNWPPAALPMMLSATRQHQSAVAPGVELTSIARTYVGSAPTADAPIVSTTAPAADWLIEMADKGV